MTEAQRLLKMLEADFDMADFNVLRNRMEDQMVRPRFNSQKREVEQEMQLPEPQGFNVGDKVRVLPDWESRMMSRDFSWFFRDRLNKAVESNAVGTVTKLTGE